MLLEARFLGLRFRFGVRVEGVVDETCEADGRMIRVWGWSYRTLQGHLEMGQMDYEVWKWLDSGEVEFRIHVVSRPARIPPPLLAARPRRRSVAQRRRPPPSLIASTIGTSPWASGASTRWPSASFSAVSQASSSCTEKRRTQSSPSSA